MERVDVVMWNAIFKPSDPSGERPVENPDPGWRMGFAPAGAWTPALSWWNPWSAPTPSASAPTIGHAGTAAEVQQLLNFPVLDDSQLHRLAKAIPELTGALDAGLRDRAMARLTRDLPTLDVRGARVAKDLLDAAHRLHNPGISMYDPVSMAQMHAEDLAVLPFALRAMELAEKSGDPHGTATFQEDVQRYADLAVQAAVRHCAAGAAGHDSADPWQDLVLVPIQLAKNLPGFPLESVMKGLHEVLQDCPPGTPVHRPLLDLQESLIKPGGHALSELGEREAQIRGSVESGRLYLPATWHQLGTDLEKIAKALDGNKEGQRRLYDALHPERRYEGGPQARCGIERRALLVLHAVAQRMRADDFQVVEPRLWRRLETEETL